MNSSAIAGAGFLVAVFWLAIVVFLVVLFLAPFKLYSIHREIRHTNDLLKEQIQLLSDIEERNRIQLGLLASLANVPAESIAGASRLGYWFVVQR